MPWIAIMASIDPSPGRSASWRCHGTSGKRWFPAMWSSWQWLFSTRSTRGSDGASVPSPGGAVEPAAARPTNDNDGSTMIVSSVPETRSEFPCGYLPSRSPPRTVTLPSARSTPSAQAERHGQMVAIDAVATLEEERIDARQPRGIAHRVKMAALLVHRAHLGRQRLDERRERRPVEVERRQPRADEEGMSRVVLAAQLGRVETEQVVEPLLDLLRRL